MLILCATSDTPEKIADFPYPTEPDDHCESPLEAYRDVVPLLHLLRSGNIETFTIYDPYYCDGGVTRNFTELGLPNVYNRKEDCYRVWASNNLPAYDVLVTNPPYSGDHIEKLFQFVSTLDRPWFLLLPQWVHKKEYYERAVSTIRPFYLVPRKRYVYVPPKDFRESKRSDTHKKSSPFVSMWYCWGGNDKTNEYLIRHVHSNSSSTSSSCDLARSKSALRDLRRKTR
jgi:hypothetical protein